MPSTTDTPPSHWLLAAATVAAAHTGVLYALWTGPSANDLALPAGQPSFTEVQVVPTVPVAAAPTQPPAVTRPARRTPPTAPPSPITDTTPAQESEPPPGAEFPPPSAATVPPATPQEEVVARADPAPEPATRSAAATHLVTPPSAQWFYEVRGESKGLNYTAHAKLDWRQDGQHYEARLEISAFLVGSRVQTSVGTLGPQGLAPAHFTDRARKEKRLVFDHEAQLIRLDGSDTTAPLTQGVQDRLSLFLQLSSVLASLRQTPEPGAQWNVAVAGTPAADTWTFHYVQTERLQLPAGPHEAWHLRRAPRKEGDQQVDLWFAPSLHFLPVRMRIQQGNGDVIDQQLTTSL